MKNKWCATIFDLFTIPTSPVTIFLLSGGGVIGGEPVGGVENPSSCGEGPPLFARSITISGESILLSADSCC